MLTKLQVFLLALFVFVYSPAAVVRELGVGGLNWVKPPEQWAAALYLPIVTSGKTITGTEPLGDIQERPGHTNNSQFPCYLGQRTLVLA